MKIAVTYSDLEYSYSFILNTEEEKAHFKELQENGANSHLENMSFEHYYRPIRIHYKDLKKINTRDEKSHFLFGLTEAIWQSETRPPYQFDLENLWCEVNWEK